MEIWSALTYTRVAMETHAEIFMKSANSSITITLQDFNSPKDLQLDFDLENGGGYTTIADGNYYGQDYDLTVYEGFPEKSAENKKFRGGEIQDSLSNKT
jgi:hypothetical protein